MNVTGWQHLWALAVSLFGREPVEIQIAAMLAAAFTALMVLEGLRASFLPRRATPASKTEHSTDMPHAPVAETVAAPPQASVLPPPLASVKNGAAQHLYAPARSAVTQNRKREHAIARAQRATRPTIRRAAPVTIMESEQAPH